MKKKEKILLIIGIILAIGLGFLMRGILLENDVDKAQIRAEIEQEIREQVKQEIDDKVLERLTLTEPDEVAEAIKYGRDIGRRAMGGEVIEIIPEEQKIRMRAMNRLAHFKQENFTFTEFLFDQEYYLIKTMVVQDDTVIRRLGDAVFSFEDISVGHSIVLTAVNPFRMGTQEILTAREIFIWR